MSDRGPVSRRETPRPSGARRRPAHRTERAARRRRLRSLWIASAAAIVLLLTRLSMVQVLDAGKYAAYAAGETEQRVALPATRGAIYDRNGNLLAVSVPTVEVVADDFQIAQPLSEARALAPILHVPATRLVPELSRRSGYVVLATNLSPKVASAGEALALNGISYLPTSERTSPDAPLFEPLLGGLNAAGAGVGGIEQMDNQLLAGRPGSEIVPEGPGGVALPSAVHSVVAPHQGSGLVLTIDEPLQVEVTKDLTRAMQLQHAHSGVAVVESVQTGAILAMVDLVAGPHGVIEPAPSNLAVTEVYEPGSVMKLATYSYALRDGVITPETPFRVPYSITIGGYTFYDAEFHPTQTMSASQMLAQSSNVGTIELAHRLGLSQLGAALDAFGFGRTTGLGWPGESAGLLGTPAQWVGSDAGSIPIGTGEAVTPLQILDAYTAVADGGVLRPPHLVAATVGASGRTAPLRIPAGHRVLSPAINREVIPMLEGVVQDGTAVCAAIPGYAVAGKTGTAQVPSPKGYVPGDFNATFVGFVPAQAPRLSAIVTLNHPTIIYGGSVAAPVFQKVMEYALGHFDIAPMGTAVPIPKACTATSGA